MWRSNRCSPAGRRPAETISSRDAVGNLDQILVRIAEIDRQQRPGGAGAPHRSFKDRRAARLQMRDHVLQRPAGQEAQVGAAGQRMRRLRLEFPPGQIDRKSVVKGKSVSVRVDLGGRRIIKQKKSNHKRYEQQLQHDTILQIYTNRRYYITYEK